MLTHNRDFYGAWKGAIVFFIYQLQVEMQASEALTGPMSSPKILCAEANTTANGST